MRKIFIGGNWKSNGSRETVAELVKTLNEGATPEGVDVVVCPPALHTGTVLSTLRKDISVCAQNVACTSKENGAFTGEHTAVMIRDFGLGHTLVGHSERRHATSGTEDVHETSEVIGKKTRYALDAGLHVIVCVGELLSEREAGRTAEVVTAQLEPVVKEIKDEEEWSRIVIAYEPVWAIGTGKTASPAQAQEVHANLRDWLAKTVSADVSVALRIVYGGSVKPGNCEALIVNKDIDGFLVGGASLTKDFLDIIDKSAAAASEGGK